MIKKAIIVLLTAACIGMTVYLIFGDTRSASPRQAVSHDYKGRYVAIEESQFERLIQALEKIADNQQPPK